MLIREFQENFHHYPTNQLAETGKKKAKFCQFEGFNYLNLKTWKEISKKAKLTQGHNKDLS